MKKNWLSVVLYACLALELPADVNYDPAKIGKYELEDPLAFADGSRLSNPAEWPRRRQEILDVFAREMYGLPPPKPDAVRLETLDEKTDCAGLSVRSRIRQHVRVGNVERHLDWTLWRPRHAASPVPVVVMLNYRGAHEMTFDPTVPPSGGWQDNDPARGITNHVATVFSQGALCKPDSISTVPLQALHARGYAFLTACYADVSPDPCEGPDHEKLQKTLAFTGLFDLWGPRDASRSDNTGSLMAWAWALSRGMDVVERIPALDARRAVVTGCSRLGKAALIAGAYDERFAVVAAHQTGGGGVPLAKRNWGENVGTEVRMFSHWYCPAYAKYAPDPARLLTFDQHLLCAAVAPRGLLVLGFNARWFDPEGEYLSLRAANPVWRFLGRGGMRDVPNPPDFSTEAVGDGLGYVRRSEGHGHCGYDWKWILDFSDAEFAGKRNAGAAVRASSFGWNAEDATECLQKALDSGAETVIIDKQASDWVVRPIVVAATNLTIVAEDGVVVRAKKGEFKGAGDCLFRFNACRNVEFRGEGRVKLVMNKVDYHNRALYKPAEWRMCISVSRWSDGMTFRNLECWSSGGDGFYVGQGRNILAEDLKCIDNYRQGMSIISCENLVCRRCVFNQTEGTAPRCGLDIEPDGPACIVSGILFEDCEFSDNRCSGALCYLCTLNGKSRPVDITFRRCRASHNGIAAYAVNAAADHNMGPGKPGPVKGRVVFENCTGFANGNAIRAHGMVPGGVEVVFRDVEINALGKDALVFSSSSVHDFSNLTFENVRIDTDRPEPIEFSPLPGAGASGLKGEIAFVDSKKNERTVDMAEWAAKQPKDPDLFNFPTATVDFNAIRAAGTKAGDKPLSTGLITSRSFQVVQVAPAAGEYPIEFEVVPYYADSAPGRIEVQCRDKLGTDLGVLKFGMGKSVHRMSVTGPNVHTFQVNLKGDVKVVVRSAHPGFGLVASGKARSFGTPGKRYFSVPADAEEVRVEIVGKSSAKILDAAGKVVAEKPYDGRNAMLLVRRAKGAKDEVWCLDIDKVFWDVSYRIAAPCLPVLSPSAEQAVVAK